MSKTKPIGETWVNWSLTDIVESGNDPMPVYKEKDGRYYTFFNKKKVYLQVVHEDDGGRDIEDYHAYISVEQARELES